jgi:hypothetical protein
MENPHAYAGGPNDPDAYENDFQQKQKLLKKV